MKIDTSKIAEQIDQLGEQKEIVEFFARNEQGEVMVLDAIFLNGRAIQAPILWTKTVSSAAECFKLCDDYTETKVKVARECLETDYLIVKALASAALQMIQKTKDKVVDQDAINIMALGDLCLEKCETLNARIVSEEIVQQFKDYLTKYPIAVNEIPQAIYDQMTEESP